MTDPTTPPLPEIEELTPTVAPAEPVAPTPSLERAGPTSAAHRRRWIVALAAVVLLVAATSVGAFLLAGAGADSIVARWAPADALAYVEVRADLPGDQRAALGEFLSAFPGFADQASLDRKLTELYDRLVSAASDGKQSYSADIAPWFGGQVGFAVGPLPAVKSLDDPAARGLAIATITDRDAALAWVRKTADEAGLAVRATDADGTPLLLMDTRDHPVAAAATDGVLLVGDQVSVRAAIERGGSGGLSTVPEFGDAMDALQGDQAAVGWVDMAAYVEWATTLPGASASGVDVSKLADLMPTWAASGLRIEPDALVGSGVVPHPSGAPDVADEPSTLPGLVPAGTVALVESHQIGQSIVDGLAQGSTTQAEQMREQLDKALAPVGGLDAAVAWIDEAGVVLLADGATPLPGVVAVPSDSTAAANLARGIRNLATLAGLKPTDESYAGTTITVVDLSSIDEGATIGARPLRLSWAITSDVVAVGLDPAFVKAVLDAPSAGTLADDARFDKLLSRAGSRHRALAWVDLDALEALVVAQLEPAERARFETDIQPYLAPLDAVIGVAQRDGSLDRTRGLLVLDEGQ